MASISNYLKSAILSHCLGIASLPKPSRLYLALFTSATDDDNGGAEFTGPALPRAGVDVSDASFSYSSGIIRNSSAIVFASPASQTFGTVTHYALYDAPTGGNRLFHGQLGLPSILNDNTPPAFQANALAITLSTGSSGMTNYLREKVAAHLFRSATFDAPTPYMGVYQFDPTSTGNQSTELQIIGPRSSLVGAITVTNGSASNPATIYLPTPAKVISAAYFGILDVDASGNMMFFGPVAVPLITQVSSPGPYCPAGALHISLG